ncbi:MAG: hypothetical protein KDC35_11985 [Acidobacteria bacterium]|nr:hypothetical protein [Acidobacteriota bacterium]
MCIRGFSVLADALSALALHRRRNLVVCIFMGLLGAVADYKSAIPGAGGWVREAGYWIREAHFVSRRSTNAPDVLDTPSQRCLTRLAHVASA